VLAGIILAAGASSRMGRPKALLDYRGEKFIERLVRVFSLVCQPVIVALGYHAEAIRPYIGAATAAVNPAPERGQLSSLKIALALLPGPCTGFLFSQVDSPAVREDTLEKLVAAFETRAAGIVFVVPQINGKHGHPVLAAREIAEEILALPPDATAREVIHGHIRQTIYIDVDDPGILTDIDTPQAYENLLQEQTH
jgi:CTP:molybdopterin cytidylyltransferase MocA